MRSPVANVGVGQEAFVDAVQRQFRQMYCEGGEGAEKEQTVVVEVGEEQLQDPEVKKGYDELKVRVISIESALNLDTGIIAGRAAMLKMTSGMLTQS